MIYTVGSENLQRQELEKKCWNPYFKDIFYRRKLFDIRLNNESAGNNESDQFCLNCGTKLRSNQQRYCSKCRKEGFGK